MSRIVFSLLALTALAACEMPNRNYDNNSSSWNYRQSDHDYSGYDGRSGSHMSSGSNSTSWGGPRHAH